MRPRLLPPAVLLLATLATLAGPVSYARAGSDGVVRPPPPPVAGPGSPATPFAAVTEEVIENASVPGKKVHVFRPTGAGVPAKAPVVLFLHGFGATGPAPYRLWLEHMARRGCIVVYPVYAGLEVPGPTSRYDTMWAGFETGLRLLSTPSAGAPAPDLGRMGVVGHSFGGGAAPAMAARAAARGYGANGMYVECWAPWFDLDRAAWASIPAHAYLLVAGFGGDAVCDPLMGEVCPARAVNVPAGHKAFRFLRSDDHGRPALAANHLTPLAEKEADALDTHGVWRLDDALADFVFGGAKAEGSLVFTTTPEALSLGTWSDGTPVAPLLDAVPADEPGKTRRVRSTWREGGGAEKGFRRLLENEAYSALPLPPPALAPASRLPRAERFLAAPPETLPVTSPDQPTLFLGVGASPAEDAIARWKAAGLVVVTPTRGPDELLEKLVKDGHPTALLVDKDRVPLLWKRADDPHLEAAVLDVLPKR